MKSKVCLDSLCAVVARCVQQKTQRATELPSCVPLLYTLHKKHRVDTGYRVAKTHRIS